MIFIGSFVALNVQNYYFRHRNNIMENTTLEEKANANTGLKWGGYAGAAYVLITYVLYLFLKDGRCVSLLYCYSYIPYLAMLAFMFLAGFEKRKLLGGYIDFKTALKNTFLVLIVTMVVYLFFQYALYKYISPTLGESVKNKNIDLITSILKNAKTPQEQITEIIEPYKNNVPIVTLAGLGQMTLFSVILGFFWAAMVALIVRKKQPTI